MIVTPLYAGLFALWYLVLSVRVVQRRGHGISLGDGGDAPLLRRIRGHGNFSEYVPFILLMMALLETSRFSIYVLHGLGATLLIARLLHGVALSFSEKWQFGRFWGTLLTFIVLLVAAGLCIYQGVLGHMLWCCANLPEGAK
jgi:uncharacterized membrane protein YecN with MAPEG domain